MPPRKTSSGSVSEDKAAPAAATVVPMSPLFPITYMYQGALRMIEVACTTRGIPLRAAIAHQHKLDQYRVRLMVLRKEEGGWANQNDAHVVPGVELRYPSQIDMVLPPLTTDSDMVHLRVEITTRCRRSGSRADSEADDGNISSPEDVMDRLNDALDRKRKPDEKSVPFTRCDQNTTETLLKQQKVTTYNQKEETLPTVYWNAIETEYKTRCFAHKVPWESGENDRRMFIDTILSNCLAPINGKLFEELDFDDFRKERLELYTEVEIKAQGIAGVGKTDYVIKRNDKLVIVIEAKRTDVTQGKHQNLAAMEAVRRINKEGKPIYSTIKGICTDYQTWMFLTREGGTIRSDRDSVIARNDSDISVPKGLREVVNKIYGMLCEVMIN